MKHSYRLHFPDVRLEDRLSPDATPLALVRDIQNGAATVSAPWLMYGDGDGGAYFTAVHPTFGEDWWHTDGTSAGTVFLKDLFIGVNEFPRAGIVESGRLYFPAPKAGTQNSGYDLWTSDGTTAGTIKLCSLGSSGASLVWKYAVAGVNGVLYFAASDSTGNELWRTDGTTAGTRLVRDINPGTSSSTPGFLANVDGTLFFVAMDNTHGRELWKSDGTSTGTVLVRDLVPGTSNPVFPGFSYASKPFSSANGLYFFSANVGNTGLEPWRSDGTSDGTFLLGDLIPGSTGSDPNKLTAVGSQVFFVASGATIGPELWKTDGTTAGTLLVRDINPGTLPSSPNYLTNLNGVLAFSANHQTSGRELWKSDGTSAGTVLVHDTNPGIASGTPNFLRNVGGALYFTNPGFNNTLWRSDGTSAGTTKLAIAPPLNPSAAQIMVSTGSGPAVSGDRLYVSANNMTFGQELHSLREDSIAPTIASITSTSPNGTYSTGQIINVTLTFSEPVTLAGGNLNVTLDTGAVLSIAPFSGTTASATYTVQAGQTSADLTVTALALAGAATLRDAAANAAVLTLPASNLAANAAIIVNPPPPTTVNVTVNAAAVQRSRLTTIELSFSNAVSATALSAPGAIALTRTSLTLGPTLDVTNGLTLSATSGMVTGLTLTFANIASPGIDYASLADGRWQIAIPYLSYQSPLGDTALRRLFGDSDNDGTVDGNDLAAFGAAFGATAANSPFDFDANGTVDAADFGQFGGRFGTSL